MDRSESLPVRAGRYVRSIGRVSSRLVDRNCSTTTGTTVCPLSRAPEIDDSHVLRSIMGVDAFGRPIAGFEVEHGKVKARNQVRWPLLRCSLNPMYHD